MKIKKKSSGLIILAILAIGFGWFAFGGEDPDPEDVNSQINEREISNSEDEKNRDYLIERNRGVEVAEIKAEAAYSIYVEDEESQILFSRNRNEKLPIASLTKLMTALVVYNNYDLSEPIGIPDSDYFTNRHLNNLRVFSDTTFEELLYPLLLESNNSGAYAAATAPEDVEFDDFISLMNKTADNLGMTRTTYHNPSGLDTVRDVNLSTARDTAKLTKHLLDIPLFWEIMEKRSYEVRSRRSGTYYLVQTTNKFLDGSYFNNSYPEWYDNIIGGKTGFTYEAMGCLVMVLEAEDGYMINVVLGASGREERFQEMEKLIDWIHKAYNI